MRVGEGVSGGWVVRKEGGGEGGEVLDASG